MSEKVMNKGVSSFTLHIIAMVLMLCDHLWATVIPGNFWLTCVGRLAFPMFAFMVVEGYHHTKSYKKYMLRLLVFAIISEMPFNIMSGGSIIYPFHQNVLWSFLIALLGVRLMDKARSKFNPIVSAVLCIIIIGVFSIMGLLTMVDYYNYGILMVFAFYIFSGETWKHWICQLLALLYINNFMMKGMYFPISIFGTTFNVYQQSFAVLSLPIIWSYKGEKGYSSKFIQYAFYAFYPVHILILGVLGILI